MKKKLALSALMSSIYFLASGYCMAATARIDVHADANISEASPTVSSDVGYLQIGDTGIDYYGNPPKEILALLQFDFKPLFNTIGAGQSLTINSMELNGYIRTAPFGPGQYPSGTDANVYLGFDDAYLQNNDADWNNQVANRDVGNLPLITTTALIGTAVYETWQTWDLSSITQSSIGTDSILTLVMDGSVSGQEGWYALQSDYSNGGPLPANRAYISLDYDITAVPVPPSILLLGSGILGLIGVARRKT